MDLLNILTATDFETIRERFDQAEEEFADAIERRKKLQLDVLYSLHGGVRTFDSAEAAKKHQEELEARVAADDTDSRSAGLTKPQFVAFFRHLLDAKSKHLNSVDELAKEEEEFKRMMQAGAWREQKRKMSMRGGGGGAGSARASFAAAASLAREGSSSANVSGDLGDAALSGSFNLGQMQTKSRRSLGAVLFKEVVEEATSNNNNNNEKEQQQQQPSSLIAKNRADSATFGAEVMLSTEFASAGSFHRESSTVRKGGRRQSTLRGAHGLTDQELARQTISQWNTSSYLSQLFHDIDYNGDATVEFSEFTSWCVASFAHSNSREFLLPVFKEYHLQSESHLFQGQSEILRSVHILTFSAVNECVLCESYTSKTLHRSSDGVKISALELHGNVEAAVAVPKAFVVSTSSNQLLVFDAPSIHSEAAPTQKPRCIFHVWPVVTVMVPLSNPLNATHGGLLLGDRKGFVRRVALDTIATSTTRFRADKVDDDPASPTYFPPEYVFSCEPPEEMCQMYEPKHERMKKSNQEEGSKPAENKKEQQQQQQQPNLLQDALSQLEQQQQEVSWGQTGGSDNDQDDDDQLPRPEEEENQQQFTPEARRPTKRRHIVQNLDASVGSLAGTFAAHAPVTKPWRLQPRDRHGNFINLKQHLSGDEHENNNNSNSNGQKKRTEATLVHGKRYSHGAIVQSSQLKPQCQVTGVVMCGFVGATDAITETLRAIVSLSTSNVVGIFDTRLGVYSGFVRTTLHSPVRNICLCERAQLAIFAGVSDRKLCTASYDVVDPKCNSLDDVEQPHHASIVSICCPADTYQIVSIDQNGCLKIWDARSFKLVHNITMQRPSVLPKGTPFHVFQVVAHERRSQLIALSGICCSTFQYDQRRVVTFAHDEPVTHLVFNPVMRTAVTVTANELRTWSLANGRCLSTSVPFPVDGSSGDDDGDDDDGSSTTNDGSRHLPRYMQSLSKGKSRRGLSVAEKQQRRRERQLARKGNEFISESAGAVERYHLKRQEQHQQMLQQQFQRTVTTAGSATMNTTMSAQSARGGTADSQQQHQHQHPSKHQIAQQHKQRLRDLISSKKKTATIAGFSGEEDDDDGSFEQQKEQQAKLGALLERAAASEPPVVTFIIPERYTQRQFLIGSSTGVLCSCLTMTGRILWRRTVAAGRSIAFITQAKRDETIVGVESGEVYSVTYDFQDGALVNWAVIEIATTPYGITHAAVAQPGGHLVAFAPDPKHRRMEIHFFSVRSRGFHLVPFVASAKHDFGLPDAVMMPEITALTFYENPTDEKVVQQEEQRERDVMQEQQHKKDDDTFSGAAAAAAVDHNSKKHHHHERPNSAQSLTKTLSLTAGSSTSSHPMGRSPSSRALLANEFMKRFDNNKSEEEQHRVHLLAVVDTHGGVTVWTVAAESLHGKELARRVVRLVAPLGVVVQRVSWARRTLLVGATDKNFLVIWRLDEIFGACTVLRESTISAPDVVSAATVQGVPRLVLSAKGDMPLMTHVLAVPATQLVVDGEQRLAQDPASLPPEENLEAEKEEGRCIVAVASTEAGDSQLRLYNLPTGECLGACCTGAGSMAADDREYIPDFCVGDAVEELVAERIASRAAAAAAKANPSGSLNTNNKQQQQQKTSNTLTNFTFEFSAPFVSEQADVNLEEEDQQQQQQQQEEEEEYDPTELPIASTEPILKQVVKRPQFHMSPEYEEHTPLIVHQLVACDKIISAYQIEAPVALADITDGMDEDMKKSAADLLRRRRTCATSESMSAFGMDGPTLVIEAEEAHTHSGSDDDSELAEATPVDVSVPLPLRQQETEASGENGEATTAAAATESKKPVADSSSDFFKLEPPTPLTRDVDAPASSSAAPPFVAPLVITTASTSRKSSVDETANEDEQQQQKAAQPAASSQSISALSAATARNRRKSVAPSSLLPPVPSSSASSTRRGTVAPSEVTATASVPEFNMQLTTSTGVGGGGDVSGRSSRASYSRGRSPSLLTGSAGQLSRECSFFADAANNDNQASADFFDAAQREQQELERQKRKRGHVLANVKRIRRKAAGASAAMQQGQSRSLASYQLQQQQQQQQQQVASGGVSNSVSRGETPSSSSWWPPADHLAASARPSSSTEKNHLEGAPDASDQRDPLSASSAANEQVLPSWMRTFGYPRSWIHRDSSAMHRDKRTNAGKKRGGGHHHHHHNHHHNHHFEAEEEPYRKNEQRNKTFIPQSQEQLAVLQAQLVDDPERSAMTPPPPPSAPYEKRRLAWLRRAERAHKLMRKQQHALATGSVRGEGTHLLNLPALELGDVVIAIRNHNPVAQSVTQQRLATNAAVFSRAFQSLVRPEAQNAVARAERVMCATRGDPSVSNVVISAPEEDDDDDAQQQQQDLPQFTTTGAFDDASPAPRPQQQQQQQQLLQPQPKKRLKKIATVMRSAVSLARVAEEAGKLTRDRSGSGLFSGGGERLDLFSDNLEAAENDHMLGVGGGGGDGGGASAERSVATMRFEDDPEEEERKRKMKEQSTLFPRRHNTNTASGSSRSLPAAARGMLSREPSKLARESSSSSVALCPPQPGAGSRRESASAVSVGAEGDGSSLHLDGIEAAQSAFFELGETESRRASISPPNGRLDTQSPPRQQQQHHRRPLPPPDPNTAFQRPTPAETIEVSCRSAKVALGDIRTRLLRDDEAKLRNSKDTLTARAEAQRVLTGAVPKELLSSGGGSSSSTGRPSRNRVTFDEQQVKDVEDNISGSSLTARQSYRKRGSVCIESSKQIVEMRSSGSVRVTDASVDSQAARTARADAELSRRASKRRSMFDSSSAQQQQQQPQQKKSTSIASSPSSVEAFSIPDTQQVVHRPPSGDSSSKHRRGVRPGSGGPSSSSSSPQSPRGMVRSSSGSDLDTAPQGIHKIPLSEQDTTSSSSKLVPNPPPPLSPSHQQHVTVSQAKTGDKNIQRAKQGRSGAGALPPQPSATNNALFRRIIANTAVAAESRREMEKSARAMVDVEYTVPHVADDGAVASARSARAAAAAASAVNLNVVGMASSASSSGRRVEPSEQPAMIVVSLPALRGATFPVKKK